jgi:hypothetical protein
MRTASWLAVAQASRATVRKRAYATRTARMRSCDRRAVCWHCQSSASLGGRWLACAVRFAKGDVPGVDAIVWWLLRQLRSTRMLQPVIMCWPLYRLVFVVGVVVVGGVVRSPAAVVVLVSVVVRPQHFAWSLASSSHLRGDTESRVCRWLSAVTQRTSQTSD